MEVPLYAWNRGPLVIHQRRHCPQSSSWSGFCIYCQPRCQQGFGAGSVAALGIGAGTLGHIFAAAFGISALLAASENAYLLIKVLGGLYLLYMGLSMLFKRTVPANSVFVSLSTSSNKTIFYQGFFNQCLKP